jgi:hypothetical protein
MSTKVFVYDGKQFSVVDPDPVSTYHPDTDTDADPDSDFLFDAVPDFYLMRMRI